MIIDIARARDFTTCKPSRKIRESLSYHQIYSRQGYGVVDDLPPFHARYIGCRRITVGQATSLRVYGSFMRNNFYTKRRYVKSDLTALLKQSFHSDKFRAQCSMVLILSSIRTTLARRNSDAVRRKKKWTLRVLSRFALFIADKSHAL